MLTRKQRELLFFVHERLQESGVSPSFDEMKEALGLRSKSGIHRLLTGLEERGFIRRLAHRARALEIVKLPEAGGFDQGPVAAPARSTGLEAAESEPVARDRSALDRPLDRPLERAAPPPSFQPFSASGGSARGHEPPSAGRWDRGAPDGDEAVLEHPPPVEVDVEAAAMTTLPLLGRIAAGTPIEALRDPSSFIDVPSGMTIRSRCYALEVDGDSMVDAGILDGDTVIIAEAEHGRTGDIVVALIDDEEVTLKRLRNGSTRITLEPANQDYAARQYPLDRVRIQGRLIGLLRQY